MFCGRTDLPLQSTRSEVVASLNAHALALGGPNASCAGQTRTHLQPRLSAHRSATF